MKINIKNELNNDVYINLLDINQNVIDDYLINNDFIEVDLNIDKYCFFYTQNEKSEIIRLSNNIEGFRVYFNDKINRLDVALFKENNSYRQVETFILKDEKNLFYRNDKSKKIDILLPLNYEENKKYSLILMFDSQNIFDLNKVNEYTDKNDPYGGWQVESSIPNDYIVVGIDNADEYRSEELTPSKNEVKFKLILNLLREKELFRGKLEHLRDFINETLFPFVLNKYNIDLDNIGICGSSCGGLASYYVGLKDYDKYSYIFTFTPATGFIKDKSLIKLYNSMKMDSKLPYIFYYQGNKGKLEHLLYKVNHKLIKNLINVGYPVNNIEQYIEESAEHNEIMWRYGFNYAVSKYLDFKEKTNGSK